MKKIALLSVPFLLVACASPKMEKPVEEMAKPENIEIDIMFKMNQRTPSQTATSYIAKTAQEIKNTAYQQIKIVGYTDKTGKEENNVLLSHRRAQLVKHTFNRNGIPNEKMLAYGLGSANNKVECGYIYHPKRVELRKCHDKNRRVEVTIEY